MSSSAVETREALATQVEVSDETLSVELADGRTITAPLAWYPGWPRLTEERGALAVARGGRASIGRP